MRSCLFASAASLCLMLSACGHGRVSADVDAQPDVEPASSPREVTSPTQRADAQASQVPPEAAPDELVVARAGEDASDAPTMRIASGEPQQEGALSSEEIRAVVRQHRAALDACYEAAASGETERVFRLNLQLTISPTGRVSEALVKRSSPEHAGLEDCLTRLILTWQFPRPRDGASVVVSYPFNFGS